MTRDDAPADTQSGYGLFTYTSAVNIGAFGRNVEYLGQYNANRTISTGILDGSGAPNIQDIEQQDSFAISFIREAVSFANLIDVFTFKFQELAQDVSEVSDGRYITSTQPLILEDNVKSHSDVGFPCAPAQLDATPVSGAGAITSGTRLYTAVVEYQLSNGELVRSAPAQAVAVTHGGSQDTTEIFVNSIAFGTKFRGEVIVIYRTVASGSTFYETLRIRDDITSGTLGTTAAVAYLDLLSDADLIGQPLLYANGGILVNNPIPAWNDITEAKGRLFFVPMDNPDVVAFTKTKVQGLDYEFNANFILEPAYGQPIALEAFLDKVFIFTKQSVTYLVGDGPNAAGVGLFPAEFTVSSRVGVKNRQDVLTVPGGIIFKSNAGFYFIDKNNQMAYIGSPVLEFDDIDILESVNVKTKNEARFTLVDGTTLVFSYAKGKWGVHKLFDGFGIRNVSTSSGMMLAHDGANAYIEDDTLFSDGATPVTMRVVTRWLNAAGPQGYQRVRWVSLIGNLKSDHTITLKVYYDGDDSTVAQTETFDSATAIPAGNDYEYRIRLDREKCRSVKFELEDSGQSGTLESAELNFLTVELADIGGINRLSDARTE